MQGIILCNIYVYSKNKLTSTEKKDFKIKYSIYEFLIIIFVFTAIAFKFVKYDIINIILSYMLLLVFLQNNGIISKILAKNSVINIIGNLNLELYFLHQPLIKYFEFTLRFININNCFFKIIIIILLCFTIFLISYIYNKKISKKLNNFLHQKLMNN